MIRAERARELAYLWHGGQDSPLYAFASSGLVADPIALAREIRDCMIGGVYLSKHDSRNLERLDKFVAERVRLTEPGAKWPHYAAPWADKNWTKV